MTTSREAQLEEFLRDIRRQVREDTTLEPVCRMAVMRQIDAALAAPPAANRDGEVVTP